jgi:Pyridine nucleotide-disulphide oxidoreductase
MMMDEEISRRLESVFHERGVQVITGTGMASVKRDGSVLRTLLDDGRELGPAALLFAAGRSVDTSDLGLGAIGIAVDGRGRVLVDERGQTSCPSVWGAGDVLGPALASVAIDQGRRPRSLHPFRHHRPTRAGPGKPGAPTRSRAHLPHRRPRRQRPRVRPLPRPDPATLNWRPAVTRPRCCGWTSGRPTVTLSSRLREGHPLMNNAWRVGFHASSTAMFARAG